MVQLASVIKVIVLRICSLRITHATVADWSLAPLPSVTLVADDCLTVAWPAVTSNGGGPILCYEVERGENSIWYTVVNCGGLGPGVRHIRTCGFAAGVQIQFNVYAINSIGVSAALSSRALYLDWLQAGPYSVVIDPGLVSSHTSGDIPSILVQSYFPSTPSPVLDTNSTDKLYVSQLVSRCKLDLISMTATLPLDISDPYYVADTNVDSNIAPVFTTALLPSAGTKGLYYLLFDGSQYAPAGAYSLQISELESGGLLGQYWSNPFFNQIADLERKDECIDFLWDQNPLLNLTSTTGILLYDLVSIRWTGFVAPLYRELFQFTIESQDYMRVWFDQVLVVDQLLSPCSACTWSVELGGVGYYHHIRIDYYHSKGFDQTTPAGITLKWSSVYSQAEQVIPSSRLFKGVYIGVDANTGSFPAISFVADILSGSQCVVTYPSSAVTAGDVLSVYVQSRDAYGQDRLTNGETFYLTLDDQTGGPTVQFTTVPVNSLVQAGYYVSDFALNITGIYLLTIVDQDGNAINPANRMEVRVIAGSAVSVWQVVSVDPSGDTLTANEPITVSVIVTDGFGNALDGSTSPPWPNIYLVAAWYQDSTSMDRLGGNFVDFDTRNNVIGSLLFSENIVPVWNETVFQTSITIPLSGEFHVQLSVDVYPVTATLEWVIHGNPQVFPSNAVIVTEPFPPASLSSGVEYTFEVQLRDAFLNVIDFPVVGLNITLGSVQVLISYEEINEVDQFACTPGGLDGMFLCAVTPVLSSPGASLSVLVNGQQASYIPSQSAGPLPAIRGPFSLDVVVGTIAAAQCVFSGYAGTYTAGKFRQTNLLLRDVNGNSLTAVPQVLPVIAVNFILASDGVTVVESLDPSTFVFNIDGSVNIPLGSNLVSPTNGWELEILVNSNPVTIPSTTRIVIVPGLATSATTVCSAISDQQEAGTDFSRSCQPFDAQNNSVNRNGLYLFCSHEYSLDLSVPLVNVVGSYNAGSYNIDTTLYLAGPYSVYCALAQQGGLFGEYFQSNDFLNLISIQVQTDEQHYGEPLLYYNEIDSSFVFDEPAVVIFGVQARSIRWSGLLMPPGTLAIQFTLVASGGVRITLNGIVWVDNLNDADVELTFDVALTAQVPAEFIIEFVPGATASFSLKWAFPTPTTPFAIHANSLLALMHVYTPTQLITVNPANVGNLSRIYYPTTMIANQPDSFTIESRDMFGNLISDVASCLDNLVGTYATCLFDITVQPDDGAIFTLSFIGKGVYQVDVTMNTDGPKLLYVSVITGPNLGDRDPLLMCPVSIVVT